MSVPRSKLLRRARIRRVSAKQRRKIEARKKWRKEQWDVGNRTCGICNLPIAEYEESTVDHREPGWGKVDDPSNWQMAHQLCNTEKGSRRDFVKEHKWEPDFSNGESSLNYKICGLCGREHD